MSNGRKWGYWQIIVEGFQFFSRPIQKSYMMNATLFKGTLKIIRKKYRY
jgi:hypothetical protein